MKNKTNKITYISIFQLTTKIINMTNLYIKNNIFNKFLYIF